MDSSLCILGLGSSRYILCHYFFSCHLLQWLIPFKYIPSVSWIRFPWRVEASSFSFLLLCCPLRVVVTAGCPHLDPKVMHSCMTFGSIGTTKDELLESLLVICIEIFCDLFSDDSYQLICYTVQKQTSLLNCMFCVRLVAINNFSPLVPLILFSIFNGINIVYL